MISVVVPLFNEAESLPELCSWIAKVMQANNFTYELIFVDDGSTDQSWEVIAQLSREYPEVKGIRFGKNYGKSPALQYGFQKASGDVVITMDADLQDSPDEIPELYAMVKNEDYDLVSGWKKKRHDSRLTKNLPSKLYNAVARKVTGLKLHDMNCGLKAYRNEVVKSIEIYGDMHRYIPYLAKNAGYINIGEKVVEHRKRQFGTTKFGMNRFVNGYLDLMTAWFLAKFGKKPMHLFGSIGSLMFVVGFIMVVIVGMNKLISLFSGLAAPLVTSSPYFYIALTAMILGTQLFLAGFLAEIIARNSSERNKYQVEKKI